MSITIRKEKGTPTTNTVGFVGEIYEDINTGVRYECIGIYKTTGSKMYGSDCDYHWEKIDMIEEKRLPSGIGGGASSWNDLKDKPFEDNSIVYYEGDDYTGLEKVDDLFDPNCVYYRLSETAPTFDELIGVRVYLNDGSDFIIYEQGLVEDDGYIDVGGAFFVVPNEVDWDGIHLGRGIWTTVSADNELRISKIYKESVKKIESKYLPEGTPYTKQNEDGSKTNTLFVKLYTDDIKLYHDKDFNNPVYKDELKKIVENHFIHLCYNECVFYPIYVSVADIDTFGCVCIYDNITDKSKVFYTDEREEK